MQAGVDSSAALHQKENSLRLTGLGYGRVRPEGRADPGDQIDATPPTVSVVAIVAMPMVRQRMSALIGDGATEIMVRRRRLSTALLISEIGGGGGGYPSADCPERQRSTTNVPELTKFPGRRRRACAMSPGGRETSHEVTSGPVAVTLRRRCLNDPRSQRIEEGSCPQQSSSC